MLIHPAMLLYVLLGVLIVYGIWTSRRSNWPIKIVVSSRGVESMRGLPASRTARVAEFLERDLAPESRVVIRAARSKSGRLRTKVTGAVDDGTRQRIRNFLYAEL
ncbi:hypothetical protein NG895_29815 [Aeoliella sp. ICT_H6.2]|uniref:DUF3634 family protein n=1 Tax=Aeoliella straminimaris TaxID=2954799 RepID=A0A9X2FH04_9BACT|nr:hypothetical protein [Aeoliella straminimaris]MCO6048112.1 hypothetical protein [Aeoliella straminimaris]